MTTRQPVTPLSRQSPHQRFTPASGGPPIDCGYTPENCRFVLAEVRGNTADASATINITFVAPVDVAGEVVTLAPADPPAATRAAAPLALTGTDTIRTLALAAMSLLGLGCLAIVLARRRHHHTLE
jgi:hypothetical protein